VRKAVVALVLTVCMPLLAADTRPVAPSIAVLAAYPRLSSFTVSPDGTRLAALEARGEERVILVWKTEALGAAPTVIGTLKMKFRSVQFIKNDTLAVSLWQPFDLRYDRTTRTFVSKFYFTDLEGKNWREPLPHGNARSELEELAQSISEPIILDALPNDPRHVLVVENTGLSQGDIYRVDVASGRADRIQRAVEDASGYVTDLTGTVRARLRLDEDGDGAYVSTELRHPDTSAWQEHFRSYARNRDRVEVLGFSADPNVAYVLSNVGRDKAAIHEYDITARKLGKVVFEHRFFDASGVAVRAVMGADFGVIQYFTFAGPGGEDRYAVSDWYRQLDQQLAQSLHLESTPQRLVDPATGEPGTVSMRIGRNWTPVSISLDRKVIVLQAESPAEPATFYLLRDGQLSQLAQTYPDIDPRSLGKSSLVYYKARDGLDIPAFLHTPDTALCGAGPWPAVIHPHGGPWARDDLRFDYSMWVPLLTSRCRVVLQPQFRGSDGWGRRLWMAGDAQWGQKMQDDKDDGARWLIEQKLAIPGRIAMFGFSYGGYAAMAAAVRPNGLYKCAIAGAGVSDIDRIWARYYTNQYFREGQSTTVKGLSPLKVADKIQIPIYVYHGERDQTVPIEQSQWFVAKAKESGQQVTWREFKDYAHGPAWTRGIMADQLRGIDEYLVSGCGGGL